MTNGAPLSTDMPVAMESYAVGDINLVLFNNNCMFIAHRLRGSLLLR